MSNEIVIQGEVVRSPDHLIALQKKAWMFLVRSLRQTDERIKATHVPVPVNLEKDYDIACELREAHSDLGRFASIESYKEYIGVSEDHYDEDTINIAIDKKTNNPREVWAISRIEAENPLTVLDIGGGYGEIALALGRKNYQVTTLTPSPVTTKVLNKAREEENLPIQAVQCIFEEFPSDRKFDVVFAGEILEHVYDDLGFLQQCVDMANKAVIATTPVGSCEMGWLPNSAWRTANEHVRCYSEASIDNLVRRIRGAELCGEIKKIPSCKGTRGQVIECFCLCLKKKGVEHGISEGYGSKNPKESQRGTCSEIREEEAIGDQGGQQADPEEVRRKDKHPIRC